MRGKDITMGAFEKGLSFEHSVLCLLNLVPNSRVCGESLICGKKIDLIFEFSFQFNRKEIAAIECKNYNKPLSREQCVQITSDYRSIVEDNSIDCLFLVTSNGITASSRHLFDNKKYFHFSIYELTQLVMRLDELILNMELQFGNDGLEEEYIEPLIQKVESGLLRDFVSCQKRGIFNKRTLSSVAKKYQHIEFKKNQTNVICNYFPDISLKIKDVINWWIEDEKVKYHIAVIGTYGIGKSSFARSIVYQQALRCKKDPSRRIPLLINLKEFSLSTSIDRLITSELSINHNVTNPSFAKFISLSKMGRFLLVLDGIDEMKSKSSSFELKMCFFELSKLYTENSKVILLGRPTIFSSEQELTNFLSGMLETDFVMEHQVIEPSLWSFERTKELIKKRISRLDRQRYDSTLLKNVLTKIEHHKDKHFLELLQRPIHVKILLQIAKYVDDIDTIKGRGELYYKFVKLCLEREVARDSNCREVTLSVIDRYNFSKALAHRMMKNGNSSIKFSDIPLELVIQYVRSPKDQFLENEHINIDKLEALKRDLILGSFLERVEFDSLIFSHKSYCEFLTAENIIDHLVEGRLEDLTALEFTEEVCEFVRDRIDLEKLSSIDVAISTMADEIDFSMWKPIGYSLAKGNVFNEYCLGTIMAGSSVICPHIGSFLFYDELQQEFTSAILIGVRKNKSEIYLKHCVEALLNGRNKEFRVALIDLLEEIFQREATPTLIDLVFKLFSQIHVDVSGEIITKLYLFGKNEFAVKITLYFINITSSKNFKSVASYIYNAIDIAECEICESTHSRIVELVNNKIPKQKQLRAS